MMEVTITSLNIQSIQTLKKWEKVEPILQGLEADIVCLWECGIIAENDYRHLKKRWTEGPLWWSGTESTKVAVVAFLIKNVRIQKKNQQIQEIVCRQLLRLATTTGEKERESLISIRPQRVPKGQNYSKN